MVNKLDNPNQWIQDTVLKIREKMQWVGEKNKDKIPYTTDETGSYDDRYNANPEWGEDEGVCWWTNGFWGGIMWLLYQDTKDDIYAEYAIESEKKLNECFDLYYGLHHDVGFMFLLTAVEDYRLTGNEVSRKIGLHAATLLAGRFNPEGEFIRAWNNNAGDNADRTGWAIIDCMMNISLLYWAWEEIHDPRFKQIAMKHADTVMKNFIREDGSSSHIVEFNPETGEFIKSHGGQGYGEGSAWTRGQGWAVYGFINSYIHTKKREYLETAKNIAKYIISNIPESGIIPIDFQQPVESELEDSCGACIIASGLLELARNVPEDEKEFYTEPAKKILRTISETRADWGKNCDAIVQNCSTAYHWGGQHITMSYADYFFIEGIYKLAGTGIFMW